MKKWFLFLVSVLILLQMQLVCYAWTPSTQFFCQVSEENIPENAVYADLLLPIPADDEDYTPYNSLNGSIFNFPEDSQIVQYNEDGYQSYTFHLENASSEIQLVTQISASQTVAQVIFLADDRNMTIQEAYERYYQFCQKYQTAKLAYLDKDGNVISVTNTVKLYKKDLLDRMPQTSIWLSGNKLSVDFNYGPPTYLIVVIPAVLLIVIVVAIVVACVKANQKKKKKQAAKANAKKRKK